MANFIRLSVALVTLFTAGGIFAPPARATEPAVTVEMTRQPCGVEIKFANNTPWHFWGDYRSSASSEGQADADLPALPPDPAGYLDAHNHGVAEDDLIGAGPLALEPWGRQHNPVHLDPGAEVVVSVRVEAVTTVSAGVRRGAERDLLVGWQEVRHVRPCSSPVVDFEDICDGVKVSLGNGEDAEADARFAISVDGQPAIQLGPIPAGLTPEPVLTGRGEIVVTEQVTDRSVTHTWSEPDGCAPVATPSPSPGVGGLPLTGDSTRVLAGGAGVALLVGAGLVWLARSRGRVRFTTE